MGVCGSKISRKNIEKTPSGNIHSNNDENKLQQQNTAASPMSSFLATPISNFYTPSQSPQYLLPNMTIDGKNSKNFIIKKSENTDIVPKNGKYKRHLVVDDSRVNGSVLRKYLNIMSIQCKNAYNGQEAIDILKNDKKFDLIWMDVQMPIMDGVTCSEIISKYDNNNFFIVGLTGHVDEFSAKRCIDSGMDYVIAKPIDKSVLREYLIYLFGNEYLID